MRSALILTIIFALIRFIYFKDESPWIFVSLALILIGGGGVVGNAIQLFKTGRVINLEILLICLIGFICGVVCFIQKVM